MADEKDLALAQKIYDVIRETLDENGWHYTEKDDLKLFFTVSGDTCQIDFFFIVEPDRKLIRVMSYLGYKFSKDKIVEAALVTSIANNSMFSGSFDLDIDDGSVAYRIGAFYDNENVATDTIHQLINYTCVTVDKYSSLFLAVSKGYLDVNGFIEKVNK